MFKKKTETIPFNTFMDGDWKEKKVAHKKQKMDELIAKASMVATGGVMLFDSETAHAGVVTGIVTDKIMGAFDPIIQLIQGISYPIAFLMMSGGFILIMTGQTGRGVGMIKWSCIGFLGLQFAPGLMEIIVTIGQSISAEMG